MSYFRFDPLCGNFDKKEFSDNYNFLSDFRMKDIKAIRAELKETTDPDREIKLRRLLQRLNDQHKSTKQSKLEKEKMAKKREKIEQEFKEGRQPHFKNKCKYFLCFGNCNIYSKDSVSLSIYIFVVFKHIRWRCVLDF